MKLNSFEFFLMNNAIRAASQRWIETPRLIGTPGSLAGFRVLEIGCGRGVGIEILLSLGAAHVVGVDIDPQMIALAGKRTSRFGERVHVFAGDVEAIDLPESSVDAVVDYGILHHVPDWRKAMREVARVLKPGGTFYFEDILKGLTDLRLVRALTDHPLKTQFTGEAFRSGLEQAGLTVTRWFKLYNWLVFGQAAKEPSPQYRE